MLALQPLLPSVSKSKHIQNTRFDMIWNIVKQSLLGGPMMTDASLQGRLLIRHNQTNLQPCMLFSFKKKRWSRWNRSGWNMIPMKLCHPGTDLILIYTLCFQSSWHVSPQLKPQCTELIPCQGPHEWWNKPVPDQVIGKVSVKKTVPPAWSVLELGCAKVSNVTWTCWPNWRNSRFLKALGTVVLSIY